jgi:GT2 family glycosyltransferase/SAM-dependent methyltransferase
VSIIISSRSPDLLRSCVTALRARTAYPNLELLLATNAIGDEALRGTCRELGLELVEVENGFFSRMNNEAARRARGELVVFLNDDTEVVTPDWIETMLGLFELPGVTAVGPRLVYPSGATQFTRAVMGIRRDGRPYIFDPFEYYGSEAVFGFSLRVATEVFAVSGGCLMVRRAGFVADGGFEEETFGFSYQDLDWMVRERQRGHTVLFTPHAVITHYAQVSKKKEPDMMAREAALASAFITRHRPSLAGGDPTWSPALFDAHGLLDPVSCLGLPNLDVPEESPAPGHGLAGWARFGSGECTSGTADTARDACRAFADRLVGATGCRTAVDLGCGVGYLLEALAALRVDAWGLDRSRAVVAAALPGIRDRVHLGDLRDVPLARSLGTLAPFDVAVASFALERLAEDHVPGVLQQVAMLARRLVLVTPRPNLFDRLDPGCLTLWSRGGWLAACGRAGWHEDPDATAALFGADCHEDPDLVLAVLVRGR